LSTKKHGCSGFSSASHPAPHFALSCHLQEQPPRPLWGPGVRYPLFFLFCLKVSGLRLSMLFKEFDISTSFLLATLRPRFMSIRRFLACLSAGSLGVLPPINRPCSFVGSTFFAYWAHVKFFEFWLHRAVGSDPYPGNLTETSFSTMVGLLCFSIDPRDPSPSNLQDPNRFHSHCNGIRHQRFLPRFAHAGNLDNFPPFPLPSHFDARMLASFGLRFGSKSPSAFVTSVPSLTFSRSFPFLYSALPSSARADAFTDRIDFQDAVRLSTTGSILPDLSITLVVGRFFFSLRWSSHLWPGVTWSLLGPSATASDKTNPAAFLLRSGPFFSKR